MKFNFPYLSLLGCIVLLSLTSSCTPTTETTPSSEQEMTQEVDPLPSWNEGQTKESIIAYVSNVTDPGSPDFIPVEDRIATFDNDGTLWSEKPAYFQFLFAADRIRELAEDHPEWSNQQPYQAILDNDMETLAQQGMKALLEIIMATHAGITTDQFDMIVQDWINNARHPTKNRPYNELIYQPMLELLTFLRENQFKTFIVSGGGIDFMRPWADNVYGIPKDQIVGSSVKIKYDYNNGNPVINRLPEIDFIDDKEGKPEGIQKHIGRKPVFAAGNSDGDLQMLRWAAASEHKSFPLYIHHTDAEREWAYDRESHIGQFDLGLDEASEKGWTVVDMAKDWSNIYPFETDGN